MVKWIMVSLSVVFITGLTGVEWTSLQAQMRQAQAPLTWQTVAGDHPADRAPNRAQGVDVAFAPTGFTASGTDWHVGLTPPALAALGPSGLAAPGAPPEGLSAAEWQSITQQIQAHAYQAVAVEGGYRAANPGQQWRTTFDGAGFLVTPQRGDWTWGLALTSYGRSGAEQPVTGRADLRADGGRVEAAWNVGLTEWWVNDPRGVEHGFTLHARPAGSGDALTLTLAVQGTLHPQARADGQGMTFMDAQGAAVVQYAGLTVCDAQGRALPARLSAAGATVQVVVDDRQAVYPLTIDPWAQQAYLKASNTEMVDAFGYAVAVSGDTVVVGAPGEASSATGVGGDQSDNSAGSAGAAYVFARSGTTWTQQAYLKASNTGAKDYFGYAVAVSGDTVVVGAPFEDSNATGVDGDQSDNSAGSAGAAYVFARSGTTWSPQAYLKASNTEANDYFGYAVAVSGDTVVVGAFLEDSNATGVDGNQGDNSASQAGAAYVFVRSGTTWTQQAYLKASNTGANDYFGYAVAVSSDTVVVGAFLEDSSATGVGGNQADNSASGAGAAYVFVRSGTTWTPQAYLKASNTEANDYFGRAVAVSGDTVVVGAYGEDSNATGVDGDQGDNSAGEAGAAYVFVADTDGDGDCNPTDPDDDNDGVLDGTDTAPLNPDVCADADSDSCDDCAVGTDDFGPLADNLPNNDGTDTDGDGLCNTGDPDDDNDGVLDGSDSAPLNPDVCTDTDSDTCDDCAVGTDNFGPLADNDPANDGTDTDSDGVCNTTDPDDDNDGVLDGNDNAPLNPDLCEDTDGDGCDDCAVGTDNFGPLADNDPANDGPDFDEDGVCDAFDPAVTLGLSDSPFAENGGVATITASLGNATTRPVTVNLAFSGTATGGGTDYTASGVSLTIPALSLSGSLTLTGVNDVIDEPDETVIVAITAVANGTESGVQQVTAVITDDEDVEITLREKVSGTEIPHQSTYNLGTVNANAFMLLEFTITNTGLTDLRLTGSPELVALSGPQAGEFQVVLPPTSPVPPGGSMDFILLFDCSSNDPRSVTVTIANNDSDEAPYVFTLVANQPAQPNSYLLWTK